MKLSIFKIFALGCVAALAQSCVKDPQDILNEGNWNHERQVLSILFENQIGTSTIETVDATTGTIDISINVGVLPDLTSVKISSLSLSYQAQASVKVGDALNFENDDRSAVITVKATTGETRDYTIRVNEFIEEVVGVWNIQNLTVYGGTGPEYGGSAVMTMTAKSWCWNTSTGPGAELDNTLTFTIEGARDNGNTYGKCVNDAGADGKYFDCIFVAKSNPETGLDVDVSSFYRQIPVGESTWERDYAAGTIKFTDKDGRVTTGSFLGACVEDMGNSKTFTITDNAFAFSLSGKDNWTYIYKDYDKFVKRPRKYWITVKKQS